MNLLPAILALLSMAQEPPRATEPARAVVERWIDAVNALDGSEESTDVLLSLYSEDALHIEGPASHQRGTVTFQGRDQIRVMAERLADTYEDIRYRLEVATARETSQPLFHETTGPWGGPSVAVLFSLARTRREDGVRTMAPGAAFFRIVDGKIARVRLLVAAGEEAEVEPLK